VHGTTIEVSRTVGESGAVGPGLAFLKGHDDIVCPEELGQLPEGHHPPFKKRSGILVVLAEGCLEVAEEK